MMPTSCTACAFHSVRPDPDPLDSFNSDDCAVWCNQKNKEVAGALRPYEVSRIPIPNWCPLRKEMNAVKIVTLYESASSDGYRPSGDGLFYLNESEAKAAGDVKHSGWSCSPLQHEAMDTGDGKFYLLASSSPVALANTPAHKEQLRQMALKKLTDSEKKILGL